MKYSLPRIHTYALVLMLCLAGCLPAAAQLQTFDQVAYVPPPGWTPERGGDHIVYKWIDNTAGTYVMVTVYGLADSSGNPAQDFAGEWQNLVASVFTANGVPASVAGHSRSGLDYREGGGYVSWGGNRAFVRLRVFGAGSIMFSVVIVASHEAALSAQAPAVQAFLDSVRLASASGGVQSPGTAPATSGGGSAGSGVPRSGMGISGVWMGFKAYYPDWEPRPRWYVFYEDGQVFEDIPRTGLAGFSRGASQADANQGNYWGTYSFANGSGSIRRPQARFPETIEANGPDKIKLDSDYFNRCRPVDGLRLQGAWTSYSNPNDPALEQLPEGQRPVFHFTADGRFVDEGVFASFLWSGDRSTDGAGSGTYEIRDFSIIFHFSDGRVKQVAFSGMLSQAPSSTSDFLFIGRSQFRKRS